MAAYIFVSFSRTHTDRYYLIANKPEAPGPSVGFPGYVYPSQELCDLYDGVPCEFVEDGCCYNTSKWCSDPEDFSTCTSIDNGAYPIGDKRVFGDQMFDPQSLTPFPNALFCLKIYLDF